MAVAGPIQLYSVAARMNEAGTEATLTTTWRTQTTDGPVEYVVEVAGVDPNAGDAYDLLKDAYDDAKAGLEAAPFSLEIQLPPAGKLRHGFPEAAP